MSSHASVRSSRTRGTHHSSKGLMYSVGASDKSARAKVGFQPKAEEASEPVSSLLLIDSCSPANAMEQDQEIRTGEVLHGLEIDEVHKILAVSISKEESVHTAHSEEVTNKVDPALVKTFEVKGAVTPSEDTVSPIKEEVKQLDYATQVPVKMRITNETPADELPKGAIIRYINGQRIVHIPAHLDKRPYVGSSIGSRVVGTLPATLAATYSSAARKMEHDDVNVTKTWLSPEEKRRVEVKARLLAGKERILAEMGANDRQKCGWVATAASPEDRKLARQKPGSELASSTVKSTPRMRVVVDKWANPPEDIVAAQKAIGESVANTVEELLTATGLQDKILAEDMVNMGEKDSRWVKNKDIKAEPVDDAGSNAWGSEIPDGLRHALSEGDDSRRDDFSDAGNNLADWTGNLGPAPVEWDGRASYNNQSTSHAKWIQTWIMDSKRGNEPIDRREQGKTLDTATTEFHDNSVPDSIACPVHDGRIYPLPEFEEPCYRDLEDELTVKFQDETAEELVANYCVNLNNKLQDDSELRAFQKRDFWEKHRNYQPLPNPHSPKANIYLRAAKGGDAAQLADLYNYYVLKTCLTVECQPIKPEEMFSRVEIAKYEDLPFVVAVLRTTKTNARNANYKKDAQWKEHIVGFASAAGMGADLKDAYRRTVEILCFVAPDHKRLGVGKCLMDRLIMIIDPYYIPRQGYDFKHLPDTNQSKYEVGGSHRRLKKILCVVPFDRDDPKEYNQVVKKFLSSWQFEEEAVLKEMGYKFHLPSKVLNVAYLSYFTPEAINIRNVD